MLLEDVKSEVTMLRKYISARPTEVETYEYNGVLNAIGAGAGAYEVAVLQISKLQAEIDNIGNKLISCVEKDANDDWIWKLESLECLYDVAKHTLPVAKLNIEFIRPLFGPLSERLLHRFTLFDNVVQDAIRLLNSDQDPESMNLDIHCIKMSIQSIYRATELANKNGRNPMDKLTKVIKTLQTMDFAEKQIMEYVNVLMNGGSSENMTESMNILKVLQNSLCIVLDQTRTFLEHIIYIYIKISVAVDHMAKKGLVEPIPRPERTVEEGEDGTNNGEATGMGEGRGEKNISDEIEETGQLEGLEGENDEGGAEGKTQQNDDGTIEMEEDIHGDLEGVDGNEMGEEENEDNAEEDNAEELADWDTGDVEEPEETQLDPKLWDKEEHKAEQNLDQGTEGVDEDDNELAAGEKSELGANEIDEKKNADEGNAEDDIETGDEEHFENVNEVDENEENEDSQMDTEETKEFNEGEVEEIEEGEKMETDEVVKEDLNSESEDNPITDKMQTYGGVAENEPQSANETIGDADKDQVAENNNESGDDSGREKISSGGAQTEIQPKDDVSTNEEKNENKSEVDVAISRLLCDSNALEDLLNANDVDEDVSSQSEVPPVGTEDEFSHIRNDDIRTSDRKTVHKGTMEESAASRDLMDSLDIQSMRPPEDKIHNVPIKRQDYTAEPIYLSEPHMSISTEFKYESVDLKREDDALLKTIDDLRCLLVDDLHSKWELISDSVSADAVELAESLRLIIDPTIASKLQGDYRTGKRLNMRRLIPYIASNYRKDRIWMRRTKLSERNYQICLAVDDSGSMKDNMMTEITCQTVCLLEKAFQLLSVGEISIGKFGVDVEMLNKFGDSLSAEELGIRLLNSLTFEQKKTDIVKMLNSMRQYFAESRFSTSRIPSHQLLIIVGDGRGALDNGAERVRSAIGGLLDDGVVTLYLAVDNPHSSIFSIKTMCRKPGAPLQLIDYMKLFPFPFYTVVQSSSAVPRAVGDSIRQWLDMSNGR